MKNTETLTLIDGIFTPDEAKEMLSVRSEIYIYPFED